MSGKPAVGKTYSWLLSRDGHRSLLPRPGVLTCRPTVCLEKRPHFYFLNHALKIDRF